MSEKNEKFRVTRRWLEFANQWLGSSRDSTKLWLWLWLDSKTF